MPKIGIIRFPGTNNEYETIRAVSSFDAEPILIEHYQLDKIESVDGIWVPGGFAYGDVLRAGTIASASRIIQSIRKLNRPILGVCNGFQILTESKLLDGVLLPNISTRFVCRWINLKILENNSYLNEIANEVLKIPVAHFEGNLWHQNVENLNKNAIGMYVNSKGETNNESNPNGSINSIAGLQDNSGKVVGLMPHPERAVFKHQGSIDGRKIIECYLKEVKS